jgi:topoisomerase-4 subunit B
MKVVVKRNEKIMESKYEHGGKIIQACREIGKTNETGTSVTFLPDKKIFPTINFNPEIIKNRLQESSFLYKKLLIIFTDKKNNNEYKFQSANGIVDYIAYINKDLNVLNKTCFLHDKHEDIETEIAFQYTTLTEQNIISFANSIKTKEGGSHENGFKLGISECINEFSRASKMLKEKEKNFEGEDIREGITAIISVRVPEKLIQYEGQTKNKLFTPLAAVAVKKTITKKLPI